MGHPPLSGTMRIRVIIAAISAGALVLLMLPLEIMTIVRGGGAGDIALIFAIGLALPALFLALMWWQVRRWRRNPEIRRRQPNKPAARIILFGNLLVLTIGNIARGVSGVKGWAGWAIGLGVVMVGAVIVFLMAKKQDRRLHFFRRPDPMPEGQEPESAPERAPTPW